MVAPAKPVRHQDHIDVRLVRERSGDRSAGPIVKEPLEEARIFAARNDDRDLCVLRFLLVDVATHCPGDVPIEALVEVEGDTQGMSDVPPLFRQDLGSVRVDAGVQRPDVKRLDRPGVPDRLKDASVQAIDQDDGHVARAGDDPDPLRLGALALTAVVAHDHHAHIVQVAERPDQP